MKYFCDKCMANPLVSKVLGINPMATFTNCISCGASLTSDNASLERRVSELESQINVIRIQLAAKGNSPTVAEDTPHE